MDAPPSGQGDGTNSTTPLRRARLDKHIVFASLGTVAFLALLYVFYDLYQSRGQWIECDDGRRQTIDVRRFGVQYSAYSFNLDVTAANKTFAGNLKLDPIQLQQLSESRQRALDFQKYVVAGYNACAISKANFAQHVRRFETLESLARQISEIAAQPAANQAAHEQLRMLVNRYIELSKEMAA